MLLHTRTGQLLLRQLLHLQLLRLASASSAAAQI
jgi:hypothetical protein